MTPVESAWAAQPRPINQAQRKHPARNRRSAMVFFDDAGNGNRRSRPNRWSLS
jgi:hypothetical protein